MAQTVQVGKTAVGVGTAVGLMILILTYFEGSKSVVYLDPLGIPTVCVGHTGPELKVGNKSTAQECLDYLDKDIQVAWHSVSKLVKVPLQVWEQMAYTSFVFNVGEGQFKNSTMLKLLNEGHHETACLELPKWVWGRDRHGTKIKLPGLVKRREFEKELCLGHNVQLGK